MNWFEKTLWTAGGIAAMFVGGPEAIAASFVARGLTVSRAFTVASQGGRHSRYLNQAVQRTVRELRRSERSLRRRANEHRERTRNNDVARNYIDGKSGKGTWDKMSQEKKEQTRDFWRKEAENYADQADIARDVRRAKEFE